MFGGGDDDAFDGDDEKPFGEFCWIFAGNPGGAGFSVEEGETIPGGGEGDTPASDMASLWKPGGESDESSSRLSLPPVVLTPFGDCWRPFSVGRFVGIDDTPFRGGSVRLAVPFAVPFGGTFMVLPPPLATPPPLLMASIEEALRKARCLFFSFFSSFFFSRKISKMRRLSCSPNFGSVSIDSGSFHRVFFFFRRGGNTFASTRKVRMGFSTPSRCTSTSQVGRSRSGTGRGSERK